MTQALTGLSLIQTSAKTAMILFMILGHHLITKESPDKNLIRNTDLQVSLGTTPPTVFQWAGILNFNLSHGLLSLSKLESRNHSMAFWDFLVKTLIIGGNMDLF
jgi:hypothetical protein